MLQHTAFPSSRAIVCQCHALYTFVDVWELQDMKLDPLGPISADREGLHGLKRGSKCMRTGGRVFPSSCDPYLGR